MVVGRETKTDGVGAALHPHNEKEGCLHCMYGRLRLSFLEHWMNDMTTEKWKRTEGAFLI